MATPGTCPPNADQVRRLADTGLNIFIFDYRGYGESTGGPPRERLVYEDAERAWTYLVRERRILDRTNGRAPGERILLN